MRAVLRNAVEVNSFVPSRIGMLCSYLCSAPSRQTRPAWSALRPGDGQDTAAVIAETESAAGKHQSRIHYTDLSQGEGDTSPRKANGIKIQPRMIQMILSVAGIRESDFSSRDRRQAVRIVRTPV